MKKIGGLIDGTIILALGLFMVLLSLSVEYGAFLNPRYRPLTGFGGTGLVLTGIIVLIRPVRKIGLVRSVVFLFFIGLFIFGLTRTVSLSIRTMDYTGGGFRIEDTVSRLELEGKEYIKINTAELFLLCDRENPAKIAGRYTVRGIVKHGDELDRIGQFVFLRTVVFCCIADAVAIGFRVDGREVPNLHDSSWVQVYGRLERAQPDENIWRSIRMPGVFTTMVHEGFIIVPDKIIAIRPPPRPLIFQIRSDEPYAY